MQINKINSKDYEHKHKYLAEKVNAVVGIEAAGNKINDNMLNWILASCDVNFEVSLDVNVEEHRLRWTTFANLSLWFE